jgi:hypothetical protein
LAWAHCPLRLARSSLPFRLGLRPRPAPVEWSNDDKEKLLSTVTQCVRTDDILCVTMKQAEALVDELNIVHPIVRVHIVDATTGKYLSRSRSPSSRSSKTKADESAVSGGATTWFEGQSTFPAQSIGQQGFKVERRCDRLLPVASQPALLPSQSLAPLWNEVRRVLIRFSFTPTILPDPVSG